MKVKEIMTKDVKTVAPTSSLQEAAQHMRECDIGPLPVCDKGKVVGIVTDRDITVRATAEGVHPAKGAVRDVMSLDLIFCYDDQDVREASRLMQEHQIRRLPVLDREKRLVGIVALGDIATQAGSDRMSGDTLESISQPSL